MKRYLIFAMLCVITGCKGHQTVTEAIRIDTTKTVYDSVAVRTALTDTTKTDAQGVVYEFVQFVDSGGVIHIDSTGEVSLQGVRLYRYTSAYQQHTKECVRQDADGTHSSLIQASSVKEQIRQEQPKTKAVKWYQTVVCRVVSLCCIAALLYAIFLYIKKRH